MTFLEYLILEACGEDLTREELKEIVQELHRKKEEKE